MAKTLNFTQFCTLYGFPCDYDTMFNAQLLGSRGLAGSISKRSITEQDKKFEEMQAQNKEAHKLFYSMVKEGLIIDGDGKLTKDGILKSELKESDKAKEAKIMILEGKIKFIKSLSTAYLKNGTLKKGYKLAVDDYQKQIDSLK